VDLKLEFDPPLPASVPAGYAVIRTGFRNVSDETYYNITLSVDAPPAVKVSVNGATFHPSVPLGDLGPGQQVDFWVVQVGTQDGVQYATEFRIDADITSEPSPEDMEYVYNSLGVPEPKRKGWRRG
jgi:hypothetical protein